MMTDHTILPSFSLIFGEQFILTFGRLMNLISLSFQQTSHFYKVESWIKTIHSLQTSILNFKLNTLKNNSFISKSRFYIISKLILPGLPDQHVSYLSRHFIKKLFVPTNAKLLQYVVSQGNQSINLDKGKMISVPD